MKFEEVVEYFGSQSEIAREMGITRGAVHLWKVRQKIPTRKQKLMAEISGGKLKADK